MKQTVTRFTYETFQCRDMMNDEMRRRGIRTKCGFEDGKYTIDAYDWTAPLAGVEHKEGK